jgi:hypothetical protein
LASMLQLSYRAKPAPPLYKNVRMAKVIVFGRFAPTPRFEG